MRLDHVAQARDQPLVWRRDLQAEPIRAARRRDGGLHRVGLELQELVTSVDACRGERGIVHDLGMASPQRLAEQGDPAGHRGTGAARRTRPAEAGNRTFGMISSTQSRSWPGSGVMVCSTKYSTPASTRAWSEPITSSGVPNR